jgi:hypothetical protein
MAQDLELRQGLSTNDTTYGLLYIHRNFYGFLRISINFYRFLRVMNCDCLCESIELRAMHGHVPHECIGPENLDGNRRS